MKTRMAKKKPISVHVTDEERAQFIAAMTRDHMVDLGPWVAMIVRRYVAGDEETRRQSDIIEAAVLDIQKRMATKDDLSAELFFRGKD
jgi:hypothetical protein